MWHLVAVFYYFTHNQRAKFRVFIGWSRILSFLKFLWSIALRPAIGWMPDRYNRHAECGQKVYRSFVRSSLRRSLTLSVWVTDAGIGARRQARCMLRFCPQHLLPHWTGGATNRTICQKFFLFLPGPPKSQIHNSLLGFNQFAHLGYIVPKCVQLEYVSDLLLKNIIQQ